MLKELMDRDRAARDYGLPRETTSPQLSPIEDAEDFAPEDFVTNAVRSPEPQRLTGQDAMEAWAVETQAMREGKTIPAIRRPSNRALQELRCPNCQCEFTAEVEI